MREKLSTHVGEMVLVEGIISTWSDNKTHRDLVITDCIVKPHDVNVNPKKQPIISREDHLHIFIKESDLEGYKRFMDFERYKKVQFIGVVNYYQRGNGTKDYGVFIIHQSSTTREMAKCIKAANQYRVKTCGMSPTQFFKERLTKTNMSYVQKVLIPKMESILSRIDKDQRIINIGLPIETMRDNFKAVLEDLKRDTAFFVNVAIHSRKVRRIKRGSVSPLCGLLPKTESTPVTGFG